MTDEDLKIFADDILDFLNGHEASCVKLRVQIEKLFGAKKVSWSAAKIKWTEEEGFRGKYERSEDFDNLDFKAMLKNLQEHNGTMWQSGYFYWVFTNGTTVGRKKKEKKGAP